MIVPSIDLIGGRAVQLEGGSGSPIVTADPLEKMREFSRVGEVAVIDLDAARGLGTNAPLIRSLAKMGRVRVGGGIRDLPTAVQWLDDGADKVIIGTAADETLLSQLPSDRVIVAVDSQDDRVLSHGWQRETGSGLGETIERFHGLCGGFLITFVEREGRLSGTDLERARALTQLAIDADVTIAGGITSAEEIAALDRFGADAQVGMALYTGRLTLTEAFTAPLTSDRADGLWPTVVTDVRGVALGLAWSNHASVRAALDTGRGVYHSRSRGPWVKGETSGAHQDLLRIDADCDRDALRFTVRQAEPGFCHLSSPNCWGEDEGIPRLARRLKAIAANPPSGSNTARLYEDPTLLTAKLIEEAGELGRAQSPNEIANEAADLIYFTLAKAAAEGVELEEISRILDRRERNVTRRSMSARSTGQP